MTMRLLAIGIAVVLLDPTLNGFDLLPDVAGWCLVLAGLWGLARRGGALYRSLLAGVVGAVAAGMVFVMFFSEVGAVVGAMAALVAAMAWLATHYWLLEGLAALAAGPEPVAAAQARRLRTLLLVLNSGSVVASLWLVTRAPLAGDEHPGGWALLALGVWAVASAVGHLAEVGFLLRHARAPWLGQLAAA